MAPLICLPGYFANNLMEVQVPTVDNEVCEMDYADFPKFVSRCEVCAGESGMDSCGVRLSFFFYNCFVQETVSHFHMIFQQY